jgi:GR25 family glycosyltransferase involved in LPS biosynthesis
LHGVLLEAFVINLDRRADRMESVAKELGRLGIKFQRVQAVDARVVDVWREVDGLKSRIYLDLKWRVPGLVGAYLSHRKIWHEMVARNLPQALIFEDDIVAENYDPSLLSLDLAPSGIELLRLEEVGIPYDSKMRTRHFSMPLLGRQAVAVPTYGLAAYILTLDGARKLLRPDKYWFNVDHFDIWERVYGLKTAVLRPAMFVQTGSVSDSKDDNHYPGYLHHMLGDLFSEDPPSFATTTYRLKWWLINAALDICGFVPRKLLLLYMWYRQSSKS